MRTEGNRSRLASGGGQVVLSSPVVLETQTESIQTLDGVAQLYQLHETQGAEDPSVARTARSYLSVEL